jgi:hypothetical protein
MQGNMQCDKNHKYQSGPFMKRNKEMPERKLKTALRSITFCQYKPIKEPSTTQYSKEGKRYYIDYPKC